RSHLVVEHYLFLITEPSTTEFYPLSLHDALPIYQYFPGGPVEEAFFYLRQLAAQGGGGATGETGPTGATGATGAVGTGSTGQPQDRKSTRLNSSHVANSYAVSRWKKKNTA